MRLLLPFADAPEVSDGRLQANPPAGNPEVGANISTTTSPVASKQEGFFVSCEDWKLIGGYLFFAVVY